MSAQAPRHNPVQIDPRKCISCVICDHVCPGDIIYAPLRKGELPDVRYPDECWLCGMCEQSCPTHAITIVFPKHMLNCQTPLRSLLGKLDPGAEEVALAGTDKRTTFHQAREG